MDTTLPSLKTMFQINDPSLLVSSGKCEAQNWTRSNLLPTNCFPSRISDDGATR